MNLFGNLKDEGRLKLLLGGHHVFGDNQLKREDYNCDY